MADVQQTTLEPRVVTILNLTPTIEWADCPMCGSFRRLTHAVGWYCGPVHEQPGEQVRGWSDGAIAAGMSVCRECHDGFYGESRA